MRSCRFTLLSRGVRSVLLCGAVVFFSVGAFADAPAPNAPDPAVMSARYYEIWNDGVQKEIDARIEKYRKADASVTLENVRPGTDIQVEQISHDFIFGAHIFNFKQLGTSDRNARYESLYGALFNSATVAFYWKKFELEPDKPRFKTEERDTEAFWNQCADPKNQPHWRRPASDQCVEFCKAKGIRIHGHPMVWGNRTWQHPDWVWENFATPEEKAKLGVDRKKLYELSTDEIFAMGKNYIQEYDRRMFERVRILANHYGDRVDSWDVVNESSVDFHGSVKTGEKVMKSAYGLMPADYPLRAFLTAQDVLPESVKLNINDYANNQNYADQTKALMAAGCKIDIIGSQMHLFNPQQTLDIAKGKEIQTPAQIWNTMQTLSQTGLPIHLSEITITAPNDDSVGRDIQAIVARNLYRMWFSIPNMMGITWWNVVDDCGAPGEPTTSGILTRDAQPKPSYYALNRLINDEWKTRFSQKAETSSPTLNFRGFKGLYRISWTDADGQARSMETRVR